MTYTTPTMVRGAPSGKLFPITSSVEWEKERKPQSENKDVILNKLCHATHARSFTNVNGKTKAATIDAHTAAVSPALGSECAIRDWNKVYTHR